MKRITTTLETNLPKLVLVPDYHYFSVMEDAYKAAGLKIKAREVGFDGSQYVGVLYVVTKPGKAAIKQMASKQKIDIESDD